MHLLRIVLFTILHRWNLATYLLTYLWINILFAIMIVRLLIAELASSVALPIMFLFEDISIHIIGLVHHPVFYVGRDSVRKKFSKFHNEEQDKTTTGNYVWIGYGIYIKAGVKIEDGAVIGMG